MKKLFSLIILIGFFLNAYSQNDSIGEYLIYHPDNEYYLIYQSDTFWINHRNITIKFVDSVSSPGRESFNEDYYLTYIRETSGSFFNYDLSPASDFINVCDSIYNDIRVDKINFGFKVELYGFIPDDVDIDQIWYLDLIDVFEAWDITMGDADIIVAVIDEGLFLDHPDIGYDNYPLENIFHNPDEDEWTPWDSPYGDGHDGIENANPPITNGKIDDWKGWNYCNYEAGPPPHVLENNNVIPEKTWGYHGTAVSGVIAAKTNNSIGIAGIAGGNYDENQGGIKILPIKFSDWRWDPVFSEWVQSVNSSSIPAAIDYAVEMGADIINMSFGLSTSNFQESIEASLANAYNSGVLLIAASGNEGYGNSISFPASATNVIAVGATDEDDERAYFPNICEVCASNCGPGLDIVAPGVEIFTLNNNSYIGSLEGTSFSAAMVSATAALVLSVNPDLTNEQVWTILKTTAEKVGWESYVDGWKWSHGFGRINTYFAVCEALKTLQPITVSANTTWDEPVISLHDIHVEIGSTLTITSTVYMGSEARLIIEEGAQVIIDGGTITNYKFCGNENSQWPGIEVYGTTSASQYYIPGYNFQLQGKLVLLNGATIENAVTAVDLWKPGFYNKTGGIIEASNATFKNNARSIHAINYKNYHPITQQEMDYFGTFTDCSFIINNEYLGDVTFNKHVDLDQVRGIKFYGCTFSLDHRATNVSQWNLGIAAYNAGFNVLPTCSTHVVPCPLIDSCRFNGFDKAIGSFNSTLIDYPVLISDAHFADNSTGIYLSATDYAVVINNFLEAGYNSPYVSNCGFANGVGIDIQQSHGFVVENNKLRKNIMATTGNYAGIRVKDCPSNHDIIYKNELDGLSFGNYAEGTNRLDPRVAYTGVEYQCNRNSHNATDFIVIDEQQPADAMIRGYHGSMDTASGNVFSRYTPSDMHFENWGTSLINYYYCDPCTDEEPINIYADPLELFEKLISDEYDCPDHFGGEGHIKLSVNERQEKEIDFIQNLSDYNSVSYLYESLVDGGDSETELSDIETAQPEDMWELRIQLLGHSPHLSQEVLRAMADRTDVFPDDILLEILSANPDELNRDTLISYLEQKENPLPEYMVSILRQAVNGVTYKTILENEMAKYYCAKTYIAQDIIHSILFDTVFNISDYRNWLDNLNNEVADRQIISSYLSENDTSSAISLLNLLPSLYGYEGKYLDYYNDYKSLIELQISLKAEGKQMSELDTTEILALESIALNEDSYAGNMARSILTYANVHQYCDCLPLIDSTYLKKVFIPEVNTRFGNDLLKISAEPNPAHTYVAFNYEMQYDHSTGLINISDVHGKKVWQIQVNGKIGQKVWNTSGMKAGVYYYNLISSGLNKSGKVVIY